MDAPRLRPQTLEEHLIFWPLVSTWGLWLLGLQLVVFPLVGVMLAALVGYRRWWPTDHPDLSAARPAPWSLLVWIAGMLAMLFALVVGHIDFELPLTAMLKSSLGWAKGWALFALFLIAGAFLHIRPRLLFRAINILGLQTLLITPFLIASHYLGLPKDLYVSPMHAIVGSEPVFFTVSLAIPEPGTLGFRLAYFAPWAPAAAFVASMFFILALFEKNWRWRLIGMAASMSMCFFTMSRLSMIAIPVTVAAMVVFSYAARPLVLSIIAPILAISIAFAEPISQVAEQAEATFTGARSDSSRIRAALQRIGLHRWETEAPVFGHGIVERGPHLVEFMPIGTHHTWVGLLFMKGIVGFVALLVPMIVTTLEMIAKSQRDRLARCAVGVMIVFALFSFGENIDGLAYLVWPGLLVIGMAARRRLRHPWFAAVRSARRRYNREANIPAWTAPSS